MGDRLSAVAAHVPVAAVRAWWRTRRPGPGLAARLDTLYMVVISTGILGALLYGTASSALGALVTPATAPVWGPALALVAVVAIARWGTWQGPVVFAAPDVGFLLAAPLSRRGLAARPLARAMAVAAGAGAVVAAVVLVGLAGHGRGVGAGHIAGLTAGLVLLSVLGVATAARVQCSARWARAVALALPASVPVGAGLVAVAHASLDGRRVVLWSGPWGWALEPVAGATTLASVVALGALALVTATATVLAVRGFGDCPTERHVVRAEARAGAVASAWAFDARSARLTLQRVTGPSRARSTRGLPVPRRPALAVPWRDASAALRSPGRALTSAALAAGASVVAVAAARHPAAETLAALGTYVAASIALEPLRLEVDQPSASQVLLRRPFGRVLLAHLVVPLTLVAASAAVAGGVAAAVGAAPARGGALALTAVAVVPAIVLCAALSSRRGGHLPVSVLATSMTVDPTGGAAAVLGWLLAWPATAAIVGGLPLVLVAHGPSLSAALTLAVAVAAGAPWILAVMLARAKR
jgi:hypothetical protein